MLRILTIIAIFLMTSSRVSSQNTLPNIIYILADDLGYGDIGHLNPVSKIPTPNIDRLASQGMTFTNAHSPSAVCTPTRYSFLTGRYSWRSEKKQGVAWLWDSPLIAEGRATLGEILQQQGYHTACIGKWHLGWDWPTTDGQPATMENEGRNVDYSQSIANGPITRGFNYYFGDDVPSFPPHAFIENDRLIVEPSEWLQKGKAGVPGAAAPGWTYEALLPTLSKKAIKYVIDRTTNVDKEPFFLFYSLSAPHTPIAPDDPFIGKSEAGRYGDFVYQIDYHIGELLAVLDSLGITDNTLVVFTSDNGATNMDGENYIGAMGSILQYGHNSSGLFRGLKSDTWEGGHHIPFIVRWPQMIKSGETNHALLSQVDMMATFTSITGASLSNKIAEDSYDASSLFLGTSSVTRKDMITQSGNGYLSIQNDTYKLIMAAGGGGLWSRKGTAPAYRDSVSGAWKNVQLYNLDLDVGEENNLAGFYPNKVESMLHELARQISDGRSTPGPKLKNEGHQIWDQVRWLNDMNRGY